MHFIAVSANFASRAKLATLVPQAAALVGAGRRFGRGDSVAPSHDAPCHDADGSTWLCIAALPILDDGALVIAGRQPALVAADDLRRVDLAAVAQRWHALGCPPAWPTTADFTPPFALALLDRGRDSVRIVADAIGLSHIYVAQDDGIAVVSSSALACAQLLGHGIDVVALYAMAQTGSMIGTDTPFAGVAKLAAGASVTLHDGVAQILMPQPASAAGEPGAGAVTVAPTVEQGAELLRSMMTALSNNFPEADFELSGGLDSRLLLAALPPAARARHAAVTTGTPHAPDVIVARQVAALTGMAHDIADPDAALAHIDLQAELEQVTHDLQFSTNPLDRVLNAVLGRRYPAPRFSGQNGEALRGFYYAGQRLGAEPTRAMAERLVDWRLITNDAVDPGLFTGAFVAAQRPVLRDRLVQLVLDCTGNTWAQKLDTLYERERMQHWCGIGISGVQHERQILMPFFDARLTAYARTMPQHSKAGAKLAAALLKALDPALATIRLDTGLAPLALAAGGWRSLWTRAGATGAKAVRKIGQRLRRTPGATVSASSTSTMFWQQIGNRGLDVAPLRNWGIFDSAALDRFASGAWRPDRPTLGFLINCVVLARALASARPHKVEGGSAPDNAVDGKLSMAANPLQAASE